MDGWGEVRWCLVCGGGGVGCVFGVGGGSCFVYGCGMCLVLGRWIDWSVVRLVFFFLNPCVLIFKDIRVCASVHVCVWLCVPMFSTH